MPTKYKAKYSGKVYNTAREAAIDNRNYISKKLSDQTRKTPLTYIGGTKNQARAEYWRQEPVMQHAVDSIAGRYKISSDALKYRLDREGFTDLQIKERNAAVTNRKSIPRGYKILNSDITNGLDYGLDDARTYIDSGKVKLINENWYDAEDFLNEKGRTTHPVNGATTADNIGIMAAHIKYFRDQAKKDYPNASDYDLDRYSMAYYNRGIGGGRKWVKDGAKGYDIKSISLEDGRVKKSSGGSIHIAPSKRGTFTAAASKHHMGVQEFASTVLRNKDRYSPAMIKKANFARNASKWNH